MSQSNAAIVATATGVLDVVAHAVTAGRAASITVGVPATDDDVVDELVGAAVANAQRLVIASHLWLAESSPSEPLARVLADAINRELASSAAVNVAATLAGAAAGGSEEEIADVIAGGRQVLTDEDLIGGAAALMLAITAEIARSLALDPVVVEFELRDRAV